MTLILRKKFHIVLRQSPWHVFDRWVQCAPTKSHFPYEGSEAGKPAPPAPRMAGTLWIFASSETNRAQRNRAPAAHPKNAVILSEQSESKGLRLFFVGFESMLRQAALSTAAKHHP